MHINSDMCPFNLQILTDKIYMISLSTTKSVKFTCITPVCSIASLNHVYLVNYTMGTTQF